GGSRQTVSSGGTTRSTMTETPSPAATAPATLTLLGPVKTISQSRPARSSASIDSFVSTHSSSWATSGTGPAASKTVAAPRTHTTRSGKRPYGSSSGACANG